MSARAAIIAAILVISLGAADRSLGRPEFYRACGNSLASFDDKVFAVLFPRIVGIFVVTTQNHHSILYPSAQPIHREGEFVLQDAIAARNDIQGQFGGGKADKAQGLYRLQLGSGRKVDFDSLHHLLRWCLAAITKHNLNIENCRLGFLDNVTSHLGNGDIRPQLVISDISRVLDSRSGLREGSKDSSQAGDAYKQASDANENKSISPFRHFLLGLQIIVGSLCAAMGIYGINDALKSDENAIIFLEADIRVLISSFGLVIGGALALFSVLALISLK